MIVGQEGGEEGNQRTKPGRAEQESSEEVLEAKWFKQSEQP